MATYSDSPEEQLAKVREAINACLTAQSYGTTKLRKDMPRLAELRALEKDLMRQIATPSAVFSLGAIDPTE